MRADLATTATKLDAWLASGGPAGARFERQLGSSWGELAAVLAILAAGLLCALALLQLRVEVREVCAAPAVQRTARVVRRLGPYRRVLAEVLLAEVTGVRVASRGVGPLTLHRPRIDLGKDRAIELWPLGRLGTKRALAAREALVRMFDDAREAHRGGRSDEGAASATPFRDARG